MPIQRRLAVRIAGVTTLLVLVTIAYFGVTSSIRERDALEDRFGLALERIVATAALRIDGDVHRHLRTLEDTKSPEFVGIRDYLREVQQVNGLREDLLYTFHVEGLGDGELTAAVMLQKDPYTGDPYRPPTENLRRLAEVARDGVPRHSDLYTDDHGTWVSAWAPIRDGAGGIVGILEADYDVTMFQAELRAELTRVLGISGIAVIAALLGSLVFARRLETALQQIREGAEAIESERYEHRIPVSRDDELGLVARQFNRTAEVLSERFHLLKFIPSHTLDAVRRRVVEGRQEDTERVDATIFFSDIRGYTEMTEGLADEDVVRMLNTYLRRQAELIREFGGTVDKFIGDAVLAVFAGADHEERAVRAACAIQREVEGMNRSGAFERAVLIGIGIACGSLVLGEVGSDERRERTLIGSVVNLASRLCSRAAAHEVVVSDPVKAAVAGLRVRSSEQVALKGFGGLVGCHVVDGVGSA